MYALKDARLYGACVKDVDEVSSTGLVSTSSAWQYRMAAFCLLRHQDVTNAHVGERPPLRLCFPPGVPVLLDIISYFKHFI